MRENILKRALSLTLCGTILVTSSGVTTYADELNGNSSEQGVIEASAYMTTTPKIMVGDTAMACMSGKNYSSTGKQIQWFRSQAGRIEDGQAIEGANSVWYTYTEDDIGYYVYAVLEYQNENEETVSLVTNLTDKPVSEKVEEVENWIVSSDARWAYDILDGTNNIQIKATEAAKDSVTGLVGDITIPSSLDGYKVTRLANGCFTDACVNTSSDVSPVTRITSIKFPDGLEEIGKDLNMHIGNTNIIIPESVKYIEGEPFNRKWAYTHNDGMDHYFRSISKITVKNPICHFDNIPSKSSPEIGGRVTYAGPVGGSLWNVYKDEIYTWMNATNLSDAYSRYRWENQGVYNAESNKLELTAKDELQQKIDENIKDWRPSSDGKFLVDDIDGTDKVVIKPSDVTYGEVIKIPETIDGKDVGAIEIDTNKGNTIIDIPSDVIIDKENTSVPGSTVISGNEGNDAEDFAKENNLVFQNKDKQLNTYEEYEAAKKSDWKESEDGYWRYRFIDGYNGVEIENIKSFGIGAVVEVPETIDGFDVTAFSGWRRFGDLYESISLPECITVMTSSTLAYYAVGYTDVTVKTTNDLTVYNRNLDMAVMEQYTSSSYDRYFRDTTITGWTGSTADNLCKNRIDGTSNENGIIVSIFVPLDSKTSLSGVSITGTNQEGQTLKATVSPAVAKTVKYTWMVSDDNTSFSEIENSDSASFVIPEGYAGKYVKVRATGLKAFDGSVESSSVQIASTDAVKITNLEINEIWSESSIGQRLTTKVSPTGAKAVYQWYRDTKMISNSSDITSSSYALSSTAEKIDGATESTYTLTPADAGKYVFAIATGIDGYYGGYESRSTVYPVKSNIGTVSIENYSNTKYVGDTLKSVLSKTENEGKVKYQWYRNTRQTNYNSNIPDGAEKIDGATDSTYILSVDDLDKYIFVAIEGIEEQGIGGTAVSTSTYQIQNNIGTVSIENYSNTKYVGDILVSKLGNTGNEGRVKYQWYRNVRQTNYGSNIYDGAEKIDGATDSTYTLTADDVDKYIFVAIEGDIEKGVIGTAVSTSTYQVYGKVTGASITGEPYIGQVLEAVKEPEGATVSYQWYRSNNGTSTDYTIYGATNSTYTLTDEDKDYYIGVKITGINSYYGSNATAYTSEIIKVAKTVLNGVSLSGENKAGETLTANVGPSDATVSYSWYVSDSADAADWIKIEGADKEIYTLTASEIGKFIKVVVEGTGNYEGRKEVISNDKVNAKDFTVSVNEANIIGETVEVSVEPADAPVIIEWFRGDSEEGPWTKVEREVDNTYTLTDEDADKFIKAVVTGTGDYEGAGKEAISTEPVKAGDTNKKELGNVSLTGETTIGETLTVDVEPADATVDVEWFRADSKEGPWTKVEREVDNTYTLTDEDADKFIKAVVTGTGDYEGEKEVITDEAVKAVEPEINKITKVTISGETMIGETLTAKVYPSTVNADIRWLASDILDGEYEEIGTGSTYILTEADLDKYVKAEATNNEDVTNVILSAATSKVSEKDEETQPGQRIKDSVEKVDYIQEDMTETAFDGEDKRDVMVYASQGQSFSVKIPKRITMDGSNTSSSVDFITEVTADISGNDVIVVKPEAESLELTEASGIKKPIVCTLDVGQTKFSIVDDTQAILETGKTANHSATVNKITAGSWSGTFNWTISVKGKEVQDSTN